MKSKNLIYTYIENSAVIWLSMRHYLKRKNHKYLQVALRTLIMDTYQAVESPKIKYRPKKYSK